MKAAKVVKTVVGGGLIAGALGAVGYAVWYLWPTKADVKSGKLGADRVEKAL